MSGHVGPSRWVRWMELLGRICRPSTAWPARFYKPVFAALIAAAWGDTQFNRRGPRIALLDVKAATCPSPPSALPARPVGPAAVGFGLPRSQRRWRRARPTWRARPRTSAGRGRPSLPIVFEVLLKPIAHRAGGGFNADVGELNAAAALDRRVKRGFGRIKHRWRRIQHRWRRIQRGWRRSR